MAEKIVTMTKTSGGKTRTVSQPQSAYEKVWKDRGWSLKSEEKKAPAPSATTGETTTGTK